MTSDKPDVTNNNISSQRHSRRTHQQTQTGSCDSMQNVILLHTLPLDQLLQLCFVVAIESCFFSLFLCSV